MKVFKQMMMCIGIILLCFDMDAYGMMEALNVDQGQLGQGLIQQQGAIDPTVRAFTNIYAKLKELERKSDEPLDVINNHINALQVDVRALAVANHEHDFGDAIDEFTSQIRFAKQSLDAKAITDDQWEKVLADMKGRFVAYKEYRYTKRNENLKLRPLLALWAQKFEYQISNTFVPETQRETLDDKFRKISKLMYKIGDSPEQFTEENERKDIENLKKEITNLSQALLNDGQGGNQQQGGQDLLNNGQGGNHQQGHENIAFPWDMMDGNEGQQRLNQLLATLGDYIEAYSVNIDDVLRDSANWKTNAEQMVHNQKVLAKREKIITFKTNLKNLTTPIAVIQNQLITKWKSVKDFENANANEDGNEGKSCMTMPSAKKNNNAAPLIENIKSLNGTITVLREDLVAQDGGKKVFIYSTPLLQWEYKLWKITTFWISVALLNMFLSDSRWKDVCFWSTHSHKIKHKHKHKPTTTTKTPYDITEYKIPPMVEIASMYALTIPIYTTIQWYAAGVSNYVKSAQRDYMNTIIPTQQVDDVNPGCWKKCKKGVKKGWKTLWDYEKIKCRSKPWGCLDIAGLGNAFKRVFYMQRERKVFWYFWDRKFMMTTGKSKDLKKLDLLKVIFIFIFTLVFSFGILMWGRENTELAKHIPKPYSLAPVNYFPMLFEMAKSAADDSWGRSVGYYMQNIFYGITLKQFEYDVFIGMPIHTFLFVVGLTFLILAKTFKLICMASTYKALKTETGQSVKLSLMNYGVWPATMGKELINAPLKSRLMTVGFFVMIMGLFMGLFYAFHKIGWEKNADDILDIVGVILSIAIFPLLSGVTLYAGKNLQTYLVNHQDPPEVAPGSWATKLYRRLTTELNQSIYIVPFVGFLVELFLNYQYDATEYLAVQYLGSVLINLVYLLGSGWSVATVIELLVGVKNFLKKFLGVPLKRVLKYGEKKYHSNQYEAEFLGNPFNENI